MVTKVGDKVLFLRVRGGGDLKRRDQSDEKQAAHHDLEQGLATLFQKCFQIWEPRGLCSSNPTLPFWPLTRYPLLPQS